MPIAIPEGFVRVPAREYHADRTAVSRSTLAALLASSPAHVKAAQEFPPEETADLAFGTAFHDHLLQPDVFRDEYQVIPVLDPRRKADKVAFERLCEEHAGKTFIDVEGFSVLEAMSASVRRHAGAARRLEHGLAELSGYWTDPVTGVRCKIRPDFLQMDQETGLILASVDLKSALNASMAGFQKATATRGYDMQAAFYQDGIYHLTGQRVPFVFVAVEKSPPYATAVYRASEEMLQDGRMKYRAALSVWKWCVSQGNWPTYQPEGEEEEISLSPWDHRRSQQYSSFLQ